MSRRTRLFTLIIPMHTNAKSCFKCKLDFKIGDKIVGKNNSRKHAKYYHKKCYEDLYI